MQRDDVRACQQLVQAHEPGAEPFRARGVQERVVHQEPHAGAGEPFQDQPSDLRGADDAHGAAEQTGRGRDRQVPGRPARYSPAVRNARLADRWIAASV